jgi:hypothetical protein
MYRYSLCGFNELPTGNSHETIDTILELNVNVTNVTKKEQRTRQDKTSEKKKEKILRKIARSKFDPQTNPSQTK